jgi:hypothetical protein
MQVQALVEKQVDASVIVGAAVAVSIGSKEEVRFVDLNMIGGGAQAVW